MKFGIVFYIIIGITSSATGVYFFKEYPIFAMMFFIATLVNIIFIFKEYNYHKNSKIIFDEQNVPDEINIKYSTSSRLINILTYSVFILMTIFFLTSSKIEFSAKNSVVFIMMITDYQLSQALKIFRSRYNSNLT